MFNAFKLYVMQSRTTTVTLSYLKTLVLISHLFFLSSLIYALFHTFISKRNCTPLKCF